MEFTSKKMKHAFFNEPKKILVCNHCVPFLDVLWFHFILNVMLGIVLDTKTLG